MPVDPRCFSAGRREPKVSGNVRAASIPVGCARRGRRSGAPGWVGPLSDVEHKALLIGGYGCADGRPLQAPGAASQFGRLANATAEMDGVNPGPDRSEHAGHPDRSPGAISLRAKTAGAEAATQNHRAFIARPRLCHAVPPCALPRSTWAFWVIRSYADRLVGPDNAEVTCDRVFGPRLAMSLGSLRP